MPELLETPYPAYFESDVVLRNGHTVRFRPVRHEDGDHLIRFYARLLRHSMHSRFFSARSPEAAAASSPTDVDYRREFGVIGELGGEIVAVAHYFAWPKRPDVAEVAF